MDEETADKLYDVVLARAGLKGKPGEKWTKEDERRFNMEMDRMPGVFRDYHYHDMAMRSKNNQDLAKSYGMPVETLLRITFAGNDMCMRHTGHPESDPPDDYTPTIPGNTFAVDIPDIEITAS